jgi:hypothetical protein
MPATAQKAPTKRIVNVTIKREADTSPDTSWLGEYSNRATSDYSIDRAHAEDCPENDKPTEAVEQVERVIAYLTSTSYAPNDDAGYQAISDAQDLCIEKQDELRECTCGERGDMQRGEYQFFNPSFNYVGKDGKPTEGLTPADVRKYTRKDYDRMESLNAGNWCFVGIRAEAEIVIGDTVQRMTSGGLWGIESDSDRDYFREVETEELAGLREVLRGVGLCPRCYVCNAQR